MPKLSLCFPYLAAALLATSSLAAEKTGIAEKKPVFGGACEICPWGAMAEVVKLEHFHH